MSSLLHNEKEITRLKPHPISFWPYYVFFLYYIVCGIYILINKEKIADWISSMVGFMGTTAVEVIFVLIWWIIVIIPAAVFSILKISWRWLIFYTLTAVFGSYLLHYANLPVFYLNYITIGVGILGVLLTDVYRRSHEYILTNLRIITKLGFLGGKSRDVFYSKIVDIVMEQGTLGKIFNYGTIIPITPSGIGTGQDMAKVTVGTGGEAKAQPVSVGVGVAIEGGKTVTVPRGRSSLVLYGVPDPGEIRRIILENMSAKEAAPYLQKAVELLEKMMDEKKDK